MNRITNLSATTVVVNGETGDQHVRLSFKAPENEKITVYRRVEKGFTFGVDYEDYFNGMLPSLDDVIFTGTVETVDGWSVYEDGAVEKSAIYVYWVGMGSSEKEIAGPAPVKVRDSRVWWHFDAVDGKMKELAEKYSCAEIINVGETVEHRPLNALIIGNRERIIAGVGAVHAGESGPEIMMTVAEQLLSESPELFEKVGLAILPTVNADMRERIASGNPWYIRKNKNGVDLNRNFDGNWETVKFAYGVTTDDPNGVTYRGPYPNSEPETQAVIRFITTVDPIITFSYHWLASITCDSFLCGSSYDENTERHKRFCDLARPYSEAFRRAAGADIWTGRMVHPLASPGGFGEWGYCHGYYTVDVEGTYFGGTSDSFKPCEHDETDYEMLCECIRLHKCGIVATMNNIAQEGK